MTACSDTSRTANGSSEQAVLGATSCEVGTDCGLSMQFPSGINPDELAIVGRTGIHVGSGSQVIGGNGRSGALVSDAGEVDVDAGSQVGSIWTKGKAFVGGGSIVHGVFFASSDSVVQSGAVVPPRGTAVGSLAAVSWNARFPSASSGDVNLEPDRARTLSPGRYGALRVASRSTLTLTTGTYYFESYQTEPQAVINVSNQAGTAIIYVRGQLVHRGKLVSAGHPSDILVGCFSTDRIDLGDEFDATLVAPQGQVVLARPTTGAHDGLYFGATVELQGGVHLNAVAPSNTGPAIAGLGATFTGAAGASLPGPVPSPTGLTYDDWVAQKNAFINQLIAANYTGARVELPAHPDAARANQPSDFSVPSNASVAVSAAAPIRPRGAGFPSADAVDDFRQQIATQETAVNTRFPFLAEPDSSVTGTYGTPVQEPAVIPQTCIFSQRPPPPPTIDPNNGSTIGSLDDFVIQPLIPDLVFGNKPSYLTFSNSDTSYTVNKDQLPAFDGYWFFLGRLSGGWNGVGMEGFIEAGTQVGCVILKHHQELVKVFVSADGALLKQAANGDVKPSFSTSLETKVLGKRIEVASWEASNNDPALAKLKKNLLDESVPLFPTAPPPIQIGPFALALNGGAEVKLPLSLNTNPNGPEVTLAPMFRVYLTVFAGINLGIQIGVDGEADVIRVDMPFKGKAKWLDHLAPTECFSSADFSMTFQSIWSTLNGKLFVTVRIKNPFPIGPDHIDIVHEEVVSWDGLKFDTGEVNLVPTLVLPLIRHDASECRLGGTTCATTATPNRSVTGFMTANQSFQVEIPYGQAVCPNQYVYEVPVTGTGAHEVWLSTLWRASDIDTEAKCNDEKLQVDVFRQDASGAWSSWDQYQILGVFQDGQCLTSFRSGGKQDDGTTNGFLGFPWSWVDLTGDIQKVRVAVGGGTGCAPHPLVLAVAKSPL